MDLINKLGYKYRRINVVFDSIAILEDIGLGKGNNYLAKLNFISWVINIKSIIDFLSQN